MELKNYYQLIFNNGKEYFVEAPTEDVEKFKKSLTRSGVFTNGEYIILRLGNAEPVHIFSENLFSVQKVNDGVIGSTTRIWRLA